MSTASVLAEVEAERQVQDSKWGQQDHRDWGYYAKRDLVAIDGATLREACDWAHGNEVGTYAHILAEEIGEAFDEARASATDKLRTELVQVAAVAVAWVEAIDRRLA